jgi:hypothetical protein
MLGSNITIADMRYFLKNVSAEKGVIEQRSQSKLSDEVLYLFSQCSLVL